MLEHLFGSQTRLLLLRLFLLHPDERFYVREIARRVKKQLNSVRRELLHLESMGLISSAEEQDKKFYKVNPEFFLFRELKGLMLKSQMSIERSLQKSMKELGMIKALFLTGVFVDRPGDPVDMLIIGNIHRERLKLLVDQFQGQFVREINYAIMNEEEFRFRKEISDKFLLQVMNNPKITVIDYDERSVPA